MRWLPNNNSIWTAQNTDRVASYGTEIQLQWQKTLAQHTVNLQSTYAYTISKNSETGKQLFFVPYNKFTFAAAHHYKKFNTQFQWLYTDFVYTQSDNDPKAIVPAFAVANLGLDYDFNLLKNTKVGVKVLNLFNSSYESLENRPMPGRHYTIYLHFKF